MKLCNCGCVRLGKLDGAYGFVAEDLAAALQVLLLATLYRAAVGASDMLVHVAVALLVLPGLNRSTAPSARRDGVEAVKAWVADRNHWAVGNFTGERMPSPAAWEDEVVYQIMTDRWNDGDPSNNLNNIQVKYGSAQWELMNTHNLASLPQYSSGGDIRGAIDRLDYLVDLGVTVLYMTPIFGHNGAYHGYCPADLTVVDPNFGTSDDFKELVREAHKRGIRVMLDIVVNHMCGPNTGLTTTTWPGSGSQRERDRCFMARAQADLQAAAADFDESLTGSIEFGDDFFPPLDAPEFYHRCGAFSLDRPQTGRGKNGRMFGDFSFIPVRIDEISNNKCQVLASDGSTCIQARNHEVCLVLRGPSVSCRTRVCTPGRKRALACNMCTLMHKRVSHKPRVYPTNHACIPPITRAPSTTRTIRVAR